MRGFKSMLGDKIKKKLCDGVYVNVGDRVVIDINKVSKCDKFMGLDCLDLSDLSHIRFKKCLLKCNGLELYRLGARYKKVVTKNVLLCVYKGVAWFLEEETLLDYLHGLTQAQLNRLLYTLGNLDTRVLTNLLGWLNYSVHSLDDNTYVAVGKSKVIKLILAGDVFRVISINNRIHRKLDKDIVEFAVNKDMLHYLDNKLCIRCLNVDITNLNINDYYCGYTVGKDELIKHILCDGASFYIVTNKNKVLLDN